MPIIQCYLKTSILDNSSKQSKFKTSFWFRILQKTSILMIPLTSLYVEYIDRPKLSEQKNSFEYSSSPPQVGLEQKHSVSFIRANNVKQALANLCKMIIKKSQTRLRRHSWCCVNKFKCRVTFNDLDTYFACLFLPEVTPMFTQINYLRSKKCTKYVNWSKVLRIGMTLK